MVLSSVDRKGSTVEIKGTRYLVDPALRRHKDYVLFDPFAPDCVLIVYDGPVVHRAMLQKPGEVPPQPASGAPAAVASRTDYLALLRADFEKRTQAKPSALDLRPARAPSELSLAELVALLERCRACLLSPDERTRVSALWRKPRPLDPAASSAALTRAKNGCPGPRGRALVVTHRPS